MDFIFVIFDHIYYHPLFIPIIILSIIFLHPFETLLHELGHTFATLLCYFVFCIKEHKTELKLKIYWKYKIPNIFRKAYITNAGTNSKFRNYIIDKPQYKNYYKTIILGGLIFGSIFMLTIFVSNLFIPYLTIQIILGINSFIWILLNIIYFFDSKNIIDSDYYKYLKLASK